MPTTFLSRPITEPGLAPPLLLPPQIILSLSKLFSEKGRNRRASGSRRWKFIESNTRAVVFRLLNLSALKVAMSRCLNLCLLVLAAFIVATNAQFPVRKPEQKVPEVDSVCMNCICQASSNCDETIKCHNGGGNSYFCGPYVVSWAYWHDGGRPGDRGRAQDFETCLNNRTCAEEAVRGYMRKYGQDCDNNGVINCDDFVRIHKLGFGACGGNAIHDSDYWKKYDICYYGYQPDADYNSEARHFDYGEDQIQARRMPQD